MQHCELDIRYSRHKDGNIIFVKQRNMRRQEEGFSSSIITSQQPKPKDPPWQLHLHVHCSGFKCHHSTGSIASTVPTISAAVPSLCSSKPRSKYSTSMALLGKYTSSAAGPRSSKASTRRSRRDDFLDNISEDLTYNMSRFIHAEEYFMYGHPKPHMDHATKIFSSDTGFLEHSGRELKASLHEGSTVDEILLEVGTWTNDWFIPALDSATKVVEHCDGPNGN